MAPLRVKPKAGCRYDLVSLGEVMLRLDPGEGRIHTTRAFQVWEGGGEYNVARGLKRCFGLETAVVTALVDNPVGRLVQDLIYQGGVDQSHVRWVKDDGVGRTSRNGLNFTERGFGVRAAVGCSDRGHTAVSQLKPGDIDWEKIFGKEGARWLHTGGIFAALSETTPLVAKEAMQAAKKHGTIVSYDLNYRPSLWKSIGGQKQAQEVNRELAPFVDVMLGNEEDFTAALGFEVEGVDEHLSGLDPPELREHDREGRRRLPQLQGRGHHAAQRQHRHRQRLGRGLLLRRLGSTWRRTARAWRSSIGSEAAIPSPPGSIYGFLAGKGSAVGGRVRSRARRARHDHPGRHDHGHPGRGRARHEGRHGAGQGERDGRPRRAMSKHERPGDASARWASCP